jgi:hypothetical protein
MGFLDRAKSAVRVPARHELLRPLLDHDEKSELEALLEQRLFAFHAEHGGRKLLEPGWYIALSAARGADITRGQPADDELARVSVGDLLTIRSLLTSGSPQVVVSRDMVPNLATEATKILSRQINDFAERAAQGRIREG